MRKYKRFIESEKNIDIRIRKEEIFKEYRNFLIGLLFSVNIISTWFKFYGIGVAIILLLLILAMLFFIEILFLADYRAYTDGLIREKQKAGFRILGVKRK